MRGAILAGLTLAAIPCRVASAAPPNDLRPAPAKIVGGSASETCAWPGVVALQSGGLCTGTLVHPRVVVYAAHCGTFHTEVLLGEDIAAPARAVETLTCERNSDLFAVSSMDYAYCLLAEPVEDLAITPPLFGCDEDLIEVGTPVTIVGFGDTTSEGPEQVGLKHEAQTEIVGYLTTIGIGGMGTGADAGDSGGPAFVELDDGSWRMLGLVSGGGGDGATVQYVPAPVTIAWIEDRTGIDLTPCHAGDGSWAPTPACEGFYVATEPGATWAEGCPSARSGPSERCGPPWTELEDLTPPSVAFVEPLDGDALPSAPIELDVLAAADDDGVGVAEVRLAIDGAPWLDAFGLASVDQVPPYRFEGVSLAEDGEHLLELEAVDWLGNRAVVGATIIVGDPGDETGEGTTDETETGATTSSEAMDDGDGACNCTSQPGAPALPGLAALVSLCLAGRLRRPGVA
ncbi:Trypsin [Enhygromyxa salina]|uniref:Trypsin n=1 Tax=Enhygromyxa salina TaxID=215803 RepID=A0A2S9YIT9_9BACT|nr:trypsin-like serine protease [Enhygromyxa salina]PRQ05027.1 Trypsin [Enhygromyxa salina]